MITAELEAENAPSSPHSHIPAPGNQKTPGNH